MAPLNESVQEKLKELRKSFSAQLPMKLRQIEEVWEGLVQEGWDPKKAEQATQLLHTLAGTAGTFGFSSIRAAARSMGAVLKGEIGSGLEI
jgi:chemotaxis protein histidine kinase CheA